MSKFTRLLLIALVLGALCGGPLSAQNRRSEKNAATAAIQLKAVMPSSLTVKEMSNAAAPGRSAGESGPTHLLTPGKVTVVPISMSWNLERGAGQIVEAVAYFQDPLEAVVDIRGHSIPSSRVLGAFGGGSLTPFNQTDTIGPRGASLKLYSSKRMMESDRLRTVNGALSLMLSDTAQVPAGGYRGVLKIQLQVY